MDFIKKNYEKILLGIVLAGLIGVLVFMFFYISADHEAMVNSSNGYIKRTAPPLPDLDLSVESQALARVQGNYTLDFNTTNKLFNTMEWQKTADGSLIKISNGNEIGAGAAKVTGIHPLYFKLSFDETMTNEFGARYQVYVEKQAEKQLYKRRPEQHFVSVGDKNDSFELLSVSGDPSNPSALKVKLVDTGETVTVQPGKPYQRVDAYSADFSYAPEKKVFNGKRVGDLVSFAGVDYLVQDVNQDELVLEDQSNQRKYTLPYSP